MALSLLVPALFGAVGFAVRDSVPETWDEQFDQDIGRFYLHQWRQGGVAALETRFGPLQRHYGPAFATVVVAVHELLHDHLGMVSNHVASHHMASLGATCLMLWLTFWIGARLWGPGVGMLAAAMLALLPQLVAHSQNNLKDTPLAAAFTLAILLFFEAQPRNHMALAALGGAIVGFAFAIKPNGLLIWAVVAPWLLLAAPITWRRLGRLAAMGAASVAAAAGTVLVVWPYYRHQPFVRFIETLQTFRHHIYNELVFYLGQHVPAHDVPWHFPFVMMGVYTPILVLVLAGVALVLVVVAHLRRSDTRLGLALLWLWLVIPPLAQSLSGAAKLDGLRHYLAVLPPLALLAAGAAHWLWAALGPRRWLRLAAAGALAVWAMALVRTNIAYHPYQNCFFNRLAGGPRGARELFELDYWGVSLAAAADWLGSHAPAGSRVWLTIPGQHFFGIDRSRLHFADGMARRPNYKVNLVRGLLQTYDTDDNYLHPRRTPVFAVTVQGADILQVFELEEHRDVAAGSLLVPSRPEVPDARPGLSARLFDSSFSAPIGPAFTLDRLELDCTGNICSSQAVGLRASGFLRVERAGTYRFEIFSDDDALLLLEGHPVLTNASLATTATSVELAGGFYELRLDLRNDVGPACLRVVWAQVPGGPDVILAAPVLMHLPPTER